LTRLTAKLNSFQSHTEPRLVFAYISPPTGHFLPGFAQGIVAYIGDGYPNRPRMIQHERKKERDFRRMAPRMGGGEAQGGVC